MLLMVSVQVHLPRSVKVTFYICGCSDSLKLSERCIIYKVDKILHTFFCPYEHMDISLHMSNLIFCWIKTWRQRQLHFSNHHPSRENYSLFFPFPFQMATYHTLNVVGFWVLGRNSAPLSNSYYSELLKSPLWSDLFQDLALLSLFMWRLLSASKKNFSREDEVIQEA